MFGMSAITELPISTSLGEYGVNWVPVNDGQTPNWTPVVTG